MESLLEKLTSLAKRRGLIFQNSEIYGGLASTWDYGPIGAELKKNIRDYWWNYHVYQRDDIVALESAILSSNKLTKRPELETQPVSRHSLMYSYSLPNIKGSERPIFLDIVSV